MLMDFIWIEIRQHLFARVPLPLSITRPPCLPVHLLHVNLCWDLKLILSLNEMLWGLNCEYKSGSDRFCLSYICKSKIFIEDCLKEIKHNSCFLHVFHLFSGDEADWRICPRENWMLTEEAFLFVYSHKSSSSAGRTLLFILVYPY